MKIYKVGGAVRDRLLGRAVADTDWVVVGSCAEELQALGFRPVGSDFPVFLHPHTGEEYALARTERKSGQGYGGFTFYAAPEVNLEQDLRRRDLTINAIAEDENGQLIDPYQGQQDLDARLLRHVSPAFPEDPLRVLRVARFAARYAQDGFRIVDETLALMRQLSASGELAALTPERVWKELSRALLEPSPEVFLQVLQQCGALPVLLPDVAAHNLPHVLRALQLCAQTQQPLAVRWACLLMDVAKNAADVQPLQAINQRYKTPRDCQELSLLAGEFYQQAHQALALSPASLLETLHRCDVYRRPERFELWLNVCGIDWQASQNLPHQAYPPAAYLRGAAKVVNTVAIQPLLATGLTGAALGQALQQERLSALMDYQQQCLGTVNNA